MQLDKRARVELILEHWAEIWDPSAGLSDRPGDGSGVRMMSAMTRHPGVVAVGRGLELLKERDGRAFRTVSGFYAAETRIVWVESTRRRKNGSRERLRLPERQRILPRDVNAAELPDALARLAVCVPGSVDVPPELWDALMNPIAA